MHRSHQDFPSKFGVGLMVSKSPAASGEQFTRALQNFAARVGEGLQLTTRIAVHADHDPFEDGVWGRNQDARIDGVVDFRSGSKNAPLELLSHLMEARGALGNAVLRGRSTAIAGDAYLLVDKSETSPLALVAGTRRDPTINQDGLRQWWLQEHSVWMYPYFEKAAQRFEGLIADVQLTRLVCLALGFGGARYDFYEYHSFNKWDEFAGAIDAEANSLALTDEAGHLDAERGLRVGWLEEMHGAVT